MNTNYTVQPFDILGASQAEYAALNKHINLIRRERLPDDPPISLDETINWLHNIPQYMLVKAWVVKHLTSEDIIAEGMVQMLNMEENQHLAQFDIHVQPAFRRLGIGRQLLDSVTRAVHAEKRRLLLTQTYDSIPGGEAFMTRLGAQKGLIGHVNQLKIAELDRDLIRTWLNTASAQAAEFEIGLWDGPYPENQLQAITELVELTNQQPFGDLEIEDMHLTPEQLRQQEQLIFARGSQRWTYYILEKASGKFAGYTETSWNPNRPEILYQDMTGVFPEFRNKGLGRWLKAAMLNKVLMEQPQVKFVRTNNADTNAAMLKINNELGFKQYLASALWQVEIERVQAYLEQHK
jgi:GNAT superfamily N-acetyltransferase